MGTWQVIVATVLLTAASVCAQENLVVNGDFSDGLEAWAAVRPGTAPELDEEDYHTAPASLRLPPATARVGMGQDQHQFEPPLPAAATAIAWMKHAGARPTAMVGLDLKIVVDDGEVIWFMPPSLQLTASESDRWVEKTATYVAPPGRAIASLTALCLNYESGATAWFDDIEVYAHPRPETKHEVAVLYARTPDEPAAQSLSQALAAAGIEHDLLPQFADPQALKLAAVATWTEDDAFYFRLKIFHYLGGRLILCDLPQQRWARALAQYLWDRTPPEIEEAVALSDDGRAAHVRLAEGDAQQLGVLAQKLLATGIALPDEVPALDLGPKQPHSLRDGALYVGDEPLLFRSLCAYRVDGSGSLAQHEANFAHYADLRLNGLVLYLKHDTPADHLRAVLDAMWEQGLRAVVWMYGPPASPYSEKPLKDEWLLRFLPLRRHPAWLQWIMCDDTYNRYFPFVRRTSEVLHRYDQSNLITTTSMDFRWPERVTAEEWERWKQVLDFPLTYLYPLQKGRTFGGYADIEGGLEDVQRLADNVKRIWAEPVYLQQACQAHMQTFAFDRVGLPRNAIFVPTCEQQRLLTYMMLTSGTRGIIYFWAGALSDANLGTGRRAELGLLWGELEPVQDILAAGEIRSCQTSHPEVEAAAFTRNGETVVLALKHGEEYNRYVSDAVARDLRLELPFDPPEGARCLRLDGPKPLRVMPWRPAGSHGEGRGLTLEELDVTAALLITANAERIAELDRHREAWAPLAARLAATAAADTGAKTEVVAERIGPLLDDEFEQRLVEGSEAFEEVITYLHAGRHDETWRWARLAMRKWRQAQGLALERAEAEHERRRLGEEALLKLNIYPALPVFLQLYCDGPTVNMAQVRQQVLERLAQHDFLVREPVLEEKQQ